MKDNPWRTDLGGVVKNLQDNKHVRKRVFIDVDNTIYNTDQRMLDYLNGIFSKSYGIRDLAIAGDYATLYETDETIIRNGFCLEDFYKKDYLFKGVAEELAVLTQFADVVFYTNGTLVNNARKQIFLDRVFPSIRLVTDSFPVDNGKAVAKTKDMVNTHGSIFIDDSKSVLATTNSYSKILFRGNYVTPRHHIYCGKDKNRYLVSDWSGMAELIGRIIGG